MPRVSRKRLTEKTVPLNSNVQTKSLKTHGAKSKNKNFKNIFERLDGIQRSKSSSNIIGQNLNNSSSTDSIIYVGSYKLNDNYSFVDLTESMTSIKSEDSFSKPKYTHLRNCYTLYRSIIKNSTVTSTASTSCLLDSTENSKLSLNKNAKSASCLTVVNEERADEIHSPNSKYKINSDQSTELKVDDLNIIKHSLEIEEDINILNNCSPQSIISNDTCIKSLMNIYKVIGTEEFK